MAPIIPLLFSAGLGAVGSAIGTGLTSMLGLAAGGLGAGIGATL